ncbi:MAG: hypothetical protein QOJ07_800 [Thermoleophilaceae bacterium]|nr:hypothetical protein [Thermoleophilaceae bacterium]
MRFMMFMYPGENSDGPTPELVAAMSRYNEELTRAGALLALDGLHPPAASASVTFAGGKGTVIDGPFAEAKELVGGYWVIEAASKQEALEWAARCPAGDGARIEVRQIAELSDYPDDVQAAAELSRQPPEQT